MTSDAALIALLALLATCAVIAWRIHNHDDR